MVATAVSPSVGSDHRLTRRREVSEHRPLCSIVHFPDRRTHRNLNPHILPTLALAIPLAARSPILASDASDPLQVPQRVLMRHRDDSNTSPVPAVAAIGPPVRVERFPEEGNTSIAPCAANDE